MATILGQQLLGLTYVNQWTLVSHHWMNGNIVIGAINNYDLLILKTLGDPNNAAANDADLRENGLCFLNAEVEVYLFEIFNLTAPDKLSVKINTFIMLHQTYTVDKNTANQNSMVHTWDGPNKICDLNAVQLSNGFAPARITRKVLMIPLPPRLALLTPPWHMMKLKLV